MEFSAKNEGKKKLEIFLTELLKEYLEKEKENKINNKIILNETKKKKKNNSAKWE